MSGCAVYKETDFVDYFSHKIGGSEEDLLRIVAIPKCLAVINAFVNTPMRLGKALFLVGDEFDRLQLPGTRSGIGLNASKKLYPSIYVALIKQIARRIELDAGDPRVFWIDQEVKEQFRDICAFTPMSELDFQIWLHRDAPFASFDQGLEETWLTLKERDVQEWFWYWQISHSEALQDLLCNRRFVAGLEAIHRRRTPPGENVEDIYGKLDEIAACWIGSLSITLRFRLYIQIAATIATGLIDIPSGLREEFPDFYEFETEDE